MKVAYDPFAGSGDMIRTIRPLMPTAVGLDVDKTFGWQYNDSLVNIPHIDNAVIVTNPPYLAKNSAKGRGLLRHVSKYFSMTKYNDLYLLALERMLDAQDYVVAIVPETFLNSSFPKDRLVSITILERNPFSDTEIPVCIVCFGPASNQNAKIYKDNKYVTTLYTLRKHILIPSRKLKMAFNVPNGNVGLRSIDGVNQANRIKFMLPEQLNYDVSTIKITSRMITVIKIPSLPAHKVDAFVAICNKLLEEYRQVTNDLLLSPFKNNTSAGIRRRRLDFKTARSIMERAYWMLAL